MPSLWYWLTTFLSNQSEVTAAGLVVLLIGIPVAVVVDRYDLPVAIMGFGTLGIIIGIVGKPVSYQWHYWLVGGLLIVIAAIYNQNQGSGLDYP